MLLTTAYCDGIRRRYLTPVMEEELFTALLNVATANTVALAIYRRYPMTTTKYHGIQATFCVF